MNSFPPQDFDILGTTLVRYNGKAAHVVVPVGVTVIGPQAFADRITLRSVELPSTVSAIQYKAFLNCPALEYVVIPQSITELGQLLFLGSVQTTIYTPDGSAAAKYASDRRMRVRPEPPPTPDSLGIPANWDPKGHSLFAYRLGGAVRQLRGNILITVYFVTDTVSGWTAAYENEYRKVHDKAMLDLENEARQRKIPLRIHTVCKHIHTTTKCTLEYSKRWLDRWMSHCPPDSAPGYDAKPVILVLNKRLRSFATVVYTTDKPHSESKREVSVIGRGCSGFENRTICHELFHNFGASDLYEPSKVQELAELYLPDSIMNDGILVDALTAYCIGWTDILSPEAQAFLWETRKLKL